MLVISRKAGDMIKIGQDIIIKVIRLDNGRMALGIYAPPDITIERDVLLPPDHPLNEM